MTVKRRRMYKSPASPPQVTAEAPARHEVRRRRADNCVSRESDRTPQRRRVSDRLRSLARRGGRGRGCGDNNGVTSMLPQAGDAGGRDSESRAGDRDASDCSSIALSGTDIDSSDLDTVLMSVKHDNQTGAADMVRERWRLRRATKRKSANLAEASSRVEKKSIRGRATGASHVSPAVRGLLAAGQRQYAAGCFDEAIASMRAVIQQQPGLADPYHILTLIFQERGDKKRALDAMLLAAFFSKRPSEVRSVWRQVAKSSKEQGLSDQAIYAYRRSVSISAPDAEDLESMWELSQLYFENGRIARGIKVLMILHSHTRDDAIACEVARKLVATHRYREVLAFMEDVVQTALRSRARRVDLNVLNVFCEVLLHVRDFGRCATLLIDLLGLQKRCRNVAGTLDADMLTSLLHKTPLDLVAKFAAALCRLRPAGFSEDMELMSDCAVTVVLDRASSDHSDMLLMLLDALLGDNTSFTANPVDAAQAPAPFVRKTACAWSAANAQRALAAVEKVGIEEDIRERRAMCAWQSGRPDEAAEVLEEILQQPSGQSASKLRELRVRASEAWLEQGRQDKADRCLESLSYEELHRSSTLPPAMSSEIRRNTFKELSAIIEKPPYPPGDESEAAVAAIADFVRRFRQLFYDCELDRERLSSHTFHAGIVRARGGASDEELEVGSDESEGETAAGANAATAADELAGAKARTTAKADGVGDVSSGSVGSANDAGLVTETVETRAGTLSVSVAVDSQPGNVRSSALAEQRTDPSKSVVFFAEPKPQLPEEMSAHACRSVFNKTKRQHLALESLEDAFGFEAYLSFIVGGIEHFRKTYPPGKERLRQVASLVEVCEMMLAGRRLVSLRNPVKRRMLRTIACKSLSLAFEGRLWRIVFKHLRGICDQRADDGPLALFSRVLFTHEEVFLLRSLTGTGGMDDGAAWEKITPYSASGHRNTYAGSITDARAWALRKLQATPNSFGLTLLSGHFCVAASKYPLAIAEYTRAHRLNPDHSMACLCTGITYISFSMSRTAFHRHDLVLKGFAFIQLYRRLREKEGETVARQAEIAYNLGRAFHQLNIAHLAMKMYGDALSLLATDPPVQTKRPFSTEVRRAGGGSVLPAADESRCDTSAIRRSAAYNLASLCRAQGSIGMANRILMRHVVF
eukprot:TRINITY_DN48998_c0_g1_i1.p1 TRINITY_DN48998_c0_g1~~TRINITY_DN48998_c0_g1_i1.p1  ORF type:complete len:1151 (-),score=175.54 TRINITY_DN48998_c0_g1_i1:290-3742(-)